MKAFDWETLSTFQKRKLQCLKRDYPEEMKATGNLSVVALLIDELETCKEALSNSYTKHGDLEAGKALDVIRPI